MNALITFIRGLILKFYYPFLMFLGTFLKSKKTYFQSYIIKLNNSLVMKSNYQINKILLLLPHCIQNSKCEVRLTFNVFKCKRCGMCKIKDLIELAEKRGIAISIATGGTIARKMVKEEKPDAIVAVACERDLSSGIVDTYPIPVLGILNERPHGPCIDANVNLEKVKDAVECFMKNSRLDKSQ